MSSRPSMSSTPDHVHNRKALWAVTLFDRIPASPYHYSALVLALSAFFLFYSILSCVGEFSGQRGGVDRRGLCRQPVLCDQAGGQHSP